MPGSRARQGSKTAAGRRSGLARVEREIQRENVHARLAEKPELPPCGVLGDERTHFVGRESACLRDASDLVLRRRRADMRIEAACRGGDEVHGHWRLIIRI